ncbi:hypothetical protein OBK22_11905 [Empedobacter falsenii]
MKKSRITFFELDGTAPKVITRFFRVDSKFHQISDLGINIQKLIKKRFSDDDIQKLQEMKWWEWDEETLFEAMPILCSNKIDLLYKFFRKMK